MVSFLHVRAHAYTHTCTSRLNIPTWLCTLFSPPPFCSLWLNMRMWSVCEASLWSRKLYCCVGDTQNSAITLTDFIMPHGYIEYPPMCELSEWRLCIFYRNRKCSREILWRAVREVREDWNKWPVHDCKIVSILSPSDTPNKNVCARERAPSIALQALFSICFYRTIHSILSSFFLFKPHCDVM